MTGFFSSSLSLPTQSFQVSSLTQPSPHISSFIYYWPTTSMTFEYLNSRKNPSLDDRLAAIRELADGWHGHGSMRIADSVIQRVQEAVVLINQAGNLPVPEITPTSNGTISLEWENTIVSIYVEIGRTRMNGFIEGQSTGLIVIPDIHVMDRDFFRALGEIFTPSVGSTFTLRVPAKPNEYASAA